MYVGRKEKERNRGTRLNRRVSTCFQGDRRKRKRKKEAGDAREIFGGENSNVTSEPSATVRNVSTQNKGKKKKKENREDGQTV